MSSKKESIEYSNGVTNALIRADQIACLENDGIVDQVTLLHALAQLNLLGIALHDFNGINPERVIFELGFNQYITTFNELCDHRKHVFKLRQTLSLAARAAKEQRTPVVTEMHLVKTILDDQDSTAGIILRRIRDQQVHIKDCPTNCSIARKALVIKHIN